MAFALIAPKTVHNKLIFQRRDNKAPTDPDVLGLFGGSIEDGELPVEAAYRELCEETSLLIQKDALQFISETSMPTASGWAKVYLYTVQVPDGPFEVYEGAGYECFSKTEFLARSDISKGAAHLVRSAFL